MMTKLGIDLSKTNARGETVLSEITADDVGAVADTPEGRAELFASSEATSTIDASIDVRGLDRARLAPGRRWLFLGDSITNGSTAGNFAYSVSMIARQVVGSLDARSDYVEAATSGYKTSDMLSWIDTVMAGFTDIGGVVIMLGTNDSGNAAVPLATYTANMIGIVAKLRAKYGNLPIVLCTPIPRGASGATTANRRLIAQYGAWITMWGPANGCEVADTHGAVVDPATGDMSSLYFSEPDFTHPTTLGHSRMGQAVGQAMRRTYPALRRAFQFAKTTYSKVPNPMMAGGSPTSRPSSWYEQPGGTGTAPNYGVETDSTGMLPAGSWATMDFDGTTSGGTRQLATAPTFTGLGEGHQMKMLGQILIEDFTGTWEADVASDAALCRLRVANQGNVTLRETVIRFPGRRLGDAFRNGHTVWHIGPLFDDFSIPAGTTGLLLFVALKVPTGKRIKMYVGGADIVSLTELGLTAYADGAVVNLDGPPPS